MVRRQFNRSRVAPSSVLSFEAREKRTTVKHLERVDTQDVAPGYSPNQLVGIPALQHRKMLGLLYPKTVQHMVEVLPWHRRLKIAVGEVYRPKLGGVLDFAQRPIGIVQTDDAFESSIRADDIQVIAASGDESIEKLRQ